MKIVKFIAFALTLNSVKTLTREASRPVIIDSFNNKIPPEDHFSLKDLDPSCPSQIYCYGDLLRVVQMSGVFNDSKTFVDMSLKSPPDVTVKRFKEFISVAGPNPTKEEVSKFVNENFNSTSTEFIKWTPKDWKPEPKFLHLIASPELRKFGKDLNNLWKEFGRKMIDDVKIHPELYSVIYVKNPVIFPGGRFREFYYWDSYWIIRGLLYSEMFQTARGMLLNFISIIDRIGYIPNGGRIYYLQRSQPPLLAGMIKAYVDATKDYKFAIESVKYLEREFEFFMKKEPKYEVKGHVLYAYGYLSKGPRPESYFEDVSAAQSFKTEDKKEKFYIHIKAAAESGIDFSARWFITPSGGYNGTLKDIQTRNIIPVELNAILYWNAHIIATFYRYDQNIEKSAEYERKAKTIYDAIQAVLWHEDIGAWLDYDVLNNKRRDYFTPTNLSPLWTGCFNLSRREEISKSVLSYLEKREIDKYPGGIPSSLLFTKQQWDFPNAWAPMQYILIRGLEHLGTDASRELASKWATKWVKSNYEAFRKYGQMFEKYNAEKFGTPGGDGEYEVQTGFGWSNGVIIEFLTKYGDKITLPTNSSSGLLVFNSWGNYALTLLSTLASYYSVTKRIFL